MFVPFTAAHTRRRRHNAFTPINALLSATLQSIADVILHPTILLAAVAFLLGGSPYQVAAFAAIAFAAWTMTSLLSPALLAVSRPYVLVLAAGAVRLLAVIWLAFTAFRSPGRDPADTIRWLIVAFAVYQAASAIAGLASVGTLVGLPSTPRRTAVFPRRAAIGTCAAVLGGAVVWSVNRSVTAVQDGLGMLFVFAAICVAAATWFLVAIPPGRPKRLRHDETAPVSRSPLRPFATGAFRRFLLYRIATGLVAAADPFIIVLGLREAGLGIRHIGLALVACALGHLAGQLWWPGWTARRSPRTPLQVAALLRVLALVIAIGVPALVTSASWTDRFSDASVTRLLFLIPFALLGLAVSVQSMANQRYLIDIFAPATLRPAITATNLVHGVLALSPILAAYLVQRTSLDQMLWMATATAFVALLLSGLLADSRIRVNRRVGFRLGQQHLGAR